MQRLSPMYVVASVVLAIAGNAALAQTKAAPRNPVTPSPSQVNVNGQIMQSPRNGSIGPSDRADATAGTGGTAVFTPSKTGTVDVRNQQNQDATASTRASGSTSATQNAGGTATPGTTSGATSTSGSSSVNGSGATTTTNPNGTVTTTNANGTTTTTDANGNVIATTSNPLLLNGVVGGGVANADFVSDMSLETSLAQGNANVTTSSGNSDTSNATAVETARAGASMDRVINQGARDRQKIGRNGQLLYSIAPRTNVDRTNQMPDDGPTPALKGPLSR